MKMALGLQVMTLKVDNTKMKTLQISEGGKWFISLQLVFNSLSL
jgi:hypothetical protein